MGIRKSFSSTNTLTIFIVGLILATCVGYYGAYTVYQPRINENNEQIESLSSEVSNLTSTVSLLEAAVSHAIDVVNLHETQISGLEQNVSSLDSQVSSLKARAEILHGDITVDQAKELNDTIESLVILDVRTASEFESEHIGGSLNIPVSSLQEKIEELDKSDEILVYCRSGVRSTQAMEILLDNGFTKVYNMIGGIEAWMQAGYLTQGCGCG